jgi:hypothetical protein
VGVSSIPDAFYVHEACLLNYVHAGVISWMLEVGWAEKKREGLGCHLCIKRADGAVQRDYKPSMVISDEILSRICNCGSRYNDHFHNGHDRSWLDAWWKEKRMPEWKEADEVTVGNYLCGTCWYESNNAPPEQDRVDNEDIDKWCFECGDSPPQLIPVKRAADKRDEVQVRGDVEIRFHWKRQVEYEEWYSAMVDDLDEEEIAMMNEDPDAFTELLHEIAHNKSDGGDKTYMDDQAWYDDECPTDFEWEVI